MKILMVCLGNICRSPMAEGVMRQKIEKYNLDAEVNSCGTANYHIGESPDYRAIQTALNYNIDISQHKGQQFSVSDFNTYDLIFAMDNSNYSDIIAKAVNKKDIAKVKLLMDEVYPKQQKVVPDPYYGNLEDYENVYTLIEVACEHLAKRLS
ncbi:MAG: low molecular weight phosphotyrosine protein phosphatase [Bacteroidales bacterium]|nr:low molecular weight phosphotyrosine protein phosphatase [Bacteroidales bacterium]